MVTSVHNITYLLSLFRCMVAFLTCPPSCPAAALHELDVLHCQDRWHRCYWLVLGIGMGPVSSFLASCSHVWCFEYQPVIPVIDHCSCHSKLIILADHRRHLSQTLGRPLSSPWLFWHTWTLVDICGHLSTFVSICHVPTWWSGTPNGLTGVHATCVWVLVWDGWGRHPIRDSQVDKCEPESSRWSSGVSCWWFFNICKYFVNNNWECIFNVKYLHQSTYVFVWVWVLVLFPILFDCHCWLRALQLSVHVSNNLPAVGQIHKPTPVLNFWILFCFVLCFDHIQI